MINTAHDELEPILAYTNPINAASDKQLQYAEQQRRNAINAAANSTRAPSTRSPPRWPTPATPSPSPSASGSPKPTRASGSPAASAPSPRSARTSPARASEPRNGADHARNHQRHPVRHGEGGVSRARLLSGEPRRFQFWKASLYRTPRSRAYFLAGWRAHDAVRGCRPGRTPGRAEARSSRSPKRKRWSGRSSTLTRARSRRRSGASSRTRKRNVAGRRWLSAPPSPCFAAEPPAAPQPRVTRVRPTDHRAASRKPCRCVLSACPPQSADCSPGRTTGPERA